MLTALPLFYLRHPRTVFAVGGKYTAKTRQVDRGFGNHGGKPGNEAQRVNRKFFSDPAYAPKTRIA